MEKTQDSEIKCTKCEKLKKNTQFYFDPNSKKYHGWCRTCRGAYQKNYYEKNKERALSYQKDYYQKNKVSRQEYNEEWSKNNRDKIKDYHQKYYKNKALKKEIQCTKCQTVKNFKYFYFDFKLGRFLGWCKLCRKSYRKAYYQKNREKLLEFQKIYQKKEENKEYQEEYQKRWREENRDKVRKYQKTHYRKKKALTTKQLKLKMLDMHFGKEKTINVDTPLRGIDFRSENASLSRGL